MIFKQLKTVVYVIGGDNVESIVHSGGIKKKIFGVLFAN